MYDRCSITISLPTGNELEYPYATFNLLKIQICLFTPRVHEYSRLVPHELLKFLSALKVAFGKLILVFMFLFMRHS